MLFNFIAVVIIAVIVLSFWAVIRLLSPEKKAIISFILGAMVMIPWGALWFGTFIVLNPISVSIQLSVFLVLLGITAGVMGLKSKRRNFAIMGLFLFLLELLFLGYLIKILL
jgi:hypothetical protein